MTTETMFEEMRRYVRFGAADEALLARLRPHAEPHFPRIAEEFYARIREHEDAHAVFTGEAQILRLQKSMVRWMDRLLSGPWDEDYFQETAKIGRIHVRIGLPQRYMLTAMALIRLELARITDAALGAEARDVREALDRALDLELAIMLETYREDSLARIQQVERLEKQEAYDSLRRTEHRYVNAVELARVLVVGLDPSGRVRLFNHEAERVTGYARDEAFGRPFAEVLYGGADEEHGLLITQAAAGRPIANDVLESVIKNRAGKHREVRWQVAYAPSEDAGDEVVLFVIGRDITDESALAARARQSEKLAAVGTLAAGLAHEIRNPLNGAQLHVTFLERGLKKSKADADALEAVHVVADEIKRLSALVSEFLDFARPRPLDRKAVSVRALCERVVQLVGHAAAAAKVELQLMLPAQDLSLDLDPAKMEQVLLNMLQNAVEALEPAGGGRVTLRANRQPKSAVIEIEDDGPGLPSPEAPIFDPFYSTKPAGTGLGLAIVHRIVSDHDGSITVESKPGRTVFRIVLPLRSAFFQDQTHVREADNV